MQPSNQCWLKENHRDHSDHRGAPPVTAEATCRPKAGEESSSSSSSLCSLYPPWCKKFLPHDTPSPTPP